MLFETTTTDLDYITVWIIDDEDNVRLVLASLINDTADLRCTEEFPACEPALQKLETNAEAPDVILLDINLPGMTGLDALPRFKQISPSTHVIMWTGHDTENNIANGVAHHASGFLRKTEDPAKIIEAIRAVMDGGMPMDPIVVRKLVEFAHLAKDDPDK